MESNQALIVLGMHRSGTSLLTGLLAQVGVQMGKSLYAPQKGVNEKGFWEHEDIVDTHDELLLALNSQWDDLLPLSDQCWKSDTSKPYIAKLTNFVKRDFASARIWALKDPRMCRLLPFWFPIFEARQVKPSFIFMNRNPFEVVASLQKRDGFSKEKALVLWLSHSLLAESYSRGLPRVFIGFNEVVKDPVVALEKIEQALNLSFPVPVSKAKERIESFVSPDLRHHKAKDAQDEQYQGLSLMAHKLHQALNGMAVENQHSYNLIDSVAANFAAYQAKWNLELVEQIRYLNQERAKFRIMFFRIYKSCSWLLVKPIWLIEKVLRKY